MPKRKRKPGPAADWEAKQQARLDELALYNAECARGIVHTPEWDERMAKRQAKFDADRWQADDGASSIEGDRSPAKCRNCGLLITQVGKSARRSPTGWSHVRWPGWDGVRCPGRVTGAVPAT